MLDIKSILGEEYLKRFKVYYEQTLFPPDWNMLKEKRCPLCFNKLYFPLKAQIALCKSPKHKGFVISLDKLNKLN